MSREDRAELLTLTLTLALALSRSITLTPALNLTLFLTLFLTLTLTLARYLKKIEQYLAFNPAYMRLFTMLAALIIGWHWLGCLWCPVATRTACNPRVQAAAPCVPELHLRG